MRTNKNVYKKKYYNYFFHKQSIILPIHVNARTSIKIPAGKQSISFYEFHDQAVDVLPL